MNLTENFKYRILELSGLITEGKEVKLMKLGFNEALAKLLLSIDEKYALFLGDIISREFARNNNINKENLKEILPLINQGELASFIQRNEDPIINILEWLKSPLRNGEINLREIKTLTQAWEMAHEWHNSLEATGKIEDETGDIFKIYPDGMYWIDLNTNSSPEEGRAMGHCGTDSRATTLFSLRDKNKEPHVTIAYNSNTKTLTQVKGKSNKRPIDKYMEYVFDLLKEMSNKGLLDNFKWSYGTDLNDADIKQILGPKKYFFYLKNNMGITNSNLGIVR